MLLFKLLLKTAICKLSIRQMFQLTAVYVFNCAIENLYFVNTSNLLVQLLNKLSMFNLLFNKNWQLKVYLILYLVKYIKIISKYSFTNCRYI